MLFVNYGGRVKTKQCYVDNVHSLACFWHLIKKASGVIKEKPNEEEEAPSQDDLSMPELTPEEETTLKAMEQNLKQAIDGMLVFSCIPLLSLH